tara:strand:- start:15 stop:182 length:168 start_codon:yes stop_codon:yes gene_type:complete
VGINVLQRQMPDIREKISFHAPHDVLGMYGLPPVHLLRIPEARYHLKATIGAYFP